jgi:hypothetical protein
MLTMAKNACTDFLLGLILGTMQVKIIGAGCTHTVRFN